MKKWIKVQIGRYYKCPLCGRALHRVENTHIPREYICSGCNEGFVMDGMMIAQDPPYDGAPQPLISYNNTPDMELR